MRFVSIALGALLGFSLSVSAGDVLRESIVSEPFGAPGIENGLRAVPPAKLQAYGSVSEGVTRRVNIPRNTRNKNRRYVANGIRADESGLAKTVQRISLQRKARAAVTKALSDKQRQALMDFSGRYARSGMEMRISKESGVPRYIRSGSIPLAVSVKSDHESRARATLGFLEKNALMFGLANPAESFAVKRSASDAYGKHHYRFQQQVNGVPVYGAEVLAHFNSRDEIYAMTAHTVPSLLVDTEPSITPPDVAALVRGHVATPDVDIKNNELQLRKIDGRYRLVYAVESFVNQVNRWRTIVDAKSGNILSHYLDRHEASVEASGNDLNGALYTFNAWEHGGLFYMLDVKTPVLTYDEDPLNKESAYGDTYVLDFVGSEGDALDYVTSSAASGGWDATAVSAIRNGQLAFNYYKQRHGRNGIDGQNGNLRFGIHFGNNMDNAFWTGSWMIFGDGDYVFDNLATCDDVVGHEMTHGVVEHTAGLIYENQSGALNESFADFFGAMIDSGDWTMGEDCTAIAPGFLRNMRDPHQGLSAQPAHMSEFVYMPNTPDSDHGGVHVNSGIPNRAAYLIVEGLTAEGLGTSIGYEKAEKIYYRALSTYLVASSQFIDLRRGLLNAAADIYAGDATVTAAINAAFDAVGIVEGATGTPGNNRPTEADIADGDDYAVYLYPLDHVFDGNESGFAVLLQMLDTPFSGYDVDKEAGPINTVPAAGTRPAMFTSETDTVVLYVSNDYNAYWIDSAGEQALTDDGSIWSISASDDGSRLAFTANDSADNNIYVVDVASGETVAYPLTVADYQPDGGVNGTQIFFADSLDFDYTGNKIVFDALVCVPTTDLNCDPNNQYGYWTIGVLNLVNGTIHYPFNVLNPSFDIGYPAFAKNNSHIIAFDYVEYLENGNAGAATYTFDIERNEFAGDGVYRGEVPLGPEVWGVPSFWGEDDALTIQAYIGDGGRRISTVRIALSDDFSVDLASQAMYMNDHEAAFAEMHRAAYRDVSSAVLTPSATVVDFGDVEANNSKATSLTLTNNSGTDITIYAVEVSSGEFAHGFNNTRVPRGQSVSGTVAFSGSTAAGTRTGTIAFYTDTAEAPLKVNVTATVKANSNGGGGNSGGSGGGALVWLLAGIVLIRTSLFGKRVCVSSDDAKT